MGGGLCSPSFSRAGRSASHSTFMRLKEEATPKPGRFWSFLIIYGPLCLHSHLHSITSNNMQILGGGGGGGRSVVWGGGGGGGGGKDQ